MFRKFNKKRKIILKKYFLLSLFISLTISFISCSDKAPLVKIKNDSKDTIDVKFSNKQCPACPASAFLNTQPFSETDYKEISTNEYFIKFYIKDNMIGGETYFSPEINNKYKIVIDAEHKKSIETESN